MRYLFLFALTLLFACDSQFDLKTTDFLLSIDGKGQVTQLKDVKSGINYVESSIKSPLLSIRVDGEWHVPSKASQTEQTIILEYNSADIAATLSVRTEENYFRLELADISKPEKVEVVQWGRFNTSIGETIGETIGVVRNQDFALGIQALNVKTLGGYPSSEDDETPSYDIFSTTSLVDVGDSLNVLYRGHTAVITDFGSSYQAYTRNRSEDRVVASMQHERYQAPAYEDGGVVGSSIALFGTHPDRVLDVIEQIELSEGLPHPMLDGTWAKRAKGASAAYLIQSFSVDNIQKTLDLTKAAGLKYLYHGGPFENWGRFDLKKKPFPDNWESMKSLVDIAEEQGIRLGVHTLSNFITTNDPYVSPVPDSRLASVGSAQLVNAIDEETREIEISSPDFFNQMKNNSLHAVRIGSELIRYDRVSDSAPWTLLNCQRGAFGTQKTSHDTGDAAFKLADHAYKTFLTNSELGDEMSSRLADLYNQTGLRQISFDGLEGNYSTGMGQYGEVLFVKNWYDQLGESIKSGYIMDASRSGHYFWHMFTRMNWGEPWYAGFRESQTTYRLLNQDYFRRNYIPCMLGWFSMHATSSLEDIEWMLARSAAFDAGYALLTSPAIIDKNGFGNEMLHKINIWEQARMAGAFNTEQKNRMEDIKNEFSLEENPDGGWLLTPYNVKRFEHVLRVRQPGEPVLTTFEFENIHQEQPLQFVLTTTEGATASGIYLEFDDYRKVEIDISVAEGQALKYDGGDDIVLYDKHWQKLRSIKVNQDDLVLSSGSHNVKVDCDFGSASKASLKLELRTEGDKEAISKAK